MRNRSLSEAPVSKSIWCAWSYRGPCGFRDKRGKGKVSGTHQVTQKDMQDLGYTYAKRLLIVHLKVKFYWFLNFV